MNFEKYFIVGWMKLFSEKMAEMYASRISSPMETLIVRPGNLYGPHDKFTWTESKVIAATIRKVVERQDPILVWGDGMDLKDFLYIDDFIKGMLAAFENFKSHEVVNIASGEPATIRDVLAQVINSDGYKNAQVEYDLQNLLCYPVA